jgi:hypothetical protein
MKWKVKCPRSVEAEGSWFFSVEKVSSCRSIAHWQKATLLRGLVDVTPWLKFFPNVNNASRIYPIRPRTRFI